MSLTSVVPFIQGIGAAGSMPVLLVDSAGNALQNSGSLLGVSVLASNSIADGNQNCNFTVAANGNLAVVPATGLVFNGSSYDRLRGNVDAVLQASNNIAANTTYGPFTNYNGSGISLFFDVSAIPGAGTTVTFQVQVQDPASLNWVNLPNAVTAALGAVGTTLLQICPGITTAANAAVSGILPRTFRIVATVAGAAPSITFSIGASYRA